MARTEATPTVDEVHRVEPSWAQAPARWSAPELPTCPQSERAHTDALHREVLELATRAASASEAEQPSLGRHLHEKLWQLLAEQLRRMEPEPGQLPAGLGAMLGEVE
jgi:hypothetical protein